MHAERNLLAINPIIYAEVSTHFSTLEELDEVLSPLDFQRLPLPYEAGFLAAKCFLAYRRRGGQKHATVSRFFIGAHAATESLGAVDSRRFPLSYLFPFSAVNHSRLT